VQKKNPVMDFVMTNGRKLEKYRYDVQPNITIDVPFKRLVTTHLVKQREDHDSGTEVWIAPEYGNVAVKVVIIEDDGVRYEQVATKVDIQP
jgi:predicted molibdopterin-dependent oxidoreductase YjgC